MKKILKFLFLSLNLDFFIRKFNKTPRILFWHGVDFIKNNQVEAESFHVEDFKKQIDFLNKYYEIISIEEFYKRFIEDSFTKKEVVLTFDDGYLNNLTVVAPYLNEKNIPFTVFVSTEHIETGELFPTSIARLIIFGTNLKEISIPTLMINESKISNSTEKKEIYNLVSFALKNSPVDKVRDIVDDLKNNLTKKKYNLLVQSYSSVLPMNWEQLRQLKEQGATIGSHCKYHICCHKKQNYNVVKDQIQQSKVILEKKLDYICDFFAYPNGDYTLESNKFVKESGYKMGFSVEKKRISKSLNNISAIPRLGVPSDLDSLKLIMAFYPKVKFKAYNI
ncbi:polysaccharide deacetylase family protein [Acinetobacter sp. YH12239]|uniref:polysaccharide deacetylase family protein n=1 Tax=Acinetobacter sp. YH12239 TaxID=2601166 RepID=UPI0015D394F7